jgi:hypothetical protein
MARQRQRIDQVNPCGAGITASRPPPDDADEATMLPEIVHRRRPR